MKLKLGIGGGLYLDVQQLVFMADLMEEDDGMVDITLRTIGPSPLSRLRVPSTLKVSFISQSMLFPHFSHYFVAIPCEFISSVSYFWCFIYFFLLIEENILFWVIGKRIMLAWNQFVVWRIFDWRCKHWEFFINTTRECKLGFMMMIAVSGSVICALVNNIDQWGFDHIMNEIRWKNCVHFLHHKA